MLSMSCLQYVLKRCNSVRLFILLQQNTSISSNYHVLGLRGLTVRFKHQAAIKPVESSKKVQDIVLNNYDGRQRLSIFWAPTGGIEAAADGKAWHTNAITRFIADSFADDSHSLLIRGGFLRQAHAGVFQLLPLGLRVQEKLEKLLDKHMTALGASKVSLSTFSSQELWRKSGRMSETASSSPGIFQIQDRREAKFILSPTHEEEITTLVNSIVNSYKDLPLKLYQITRKYRDEARPRHGLLRTREFLMKDLYTFDTSRESALESYHITRKAYSNFFDEFKLPYMVAKAASGDMGGDLSHEFHFPTSKGEDRIVSCDACDYVANEELAEVGNSSGEKNFVSGPATGMEDLSKLLEFASGQPSATDLKDSYQQWFGSSLDGQTMVQVIYPTKKALLATGIEFSEEPQINPSLVQQEFPEIDVSVENPHGDPMKATKVYRLYDATILPPSTLLPDTVEDVCSWPPGSISTPSEATRVNKLKKPFFVSAGRELPVYEVQPGSEPRRRLLKIANGDPCAKCEKGRLHVQTAVELGHTFHLGTRYTKALNATIAIDPSKKDQTVNGDMADKAHLDGQAFMQMGCHGIGVSRLIAAAADALVDSKGLNWPRVMAPFEAIVIPTKAIGIDAQIQVYDALASSEGEKDGALDVILDDRQRDFGWKLKDADMIGYPVIVVIGRGWGDLKCEVQCRRLGIKEEVPLPNLRAFVDRLLDDL